MENMKYDEVPPCLITIDKEGRWYHNGAEMIRRDVIRLLYKNMALDSNNRYVINWQNQQCYVDVEDTAFVVWRAEFRDGSKGRDDRYMLYLSDESMEELVPETLFVGDGNVLYCRVKGRIFSARFTRAAYYQIAQFIEEEKGTFYLPLKGKKYPIPKR